MDTLPLPIDRYARSPELAPLAILETAIVACQVALLAAQPEVAYGAIEVCPKGSSAMRAHGVLVAAHRLATALAAYREALGKEERRTRRQQDRLPF